MKQNRAMCPMPDAMVQPPIKFACVFVIIRYRYAYLTSIYMLKTIKVAFLLCLFPFERIIITGVRPILGLENNYNWCEINNGFR